MNEKMIKVGISHGDINGISYELILKTFEDNAMLELCVPIVYGSSKVLSYHKKGLELPSLNINTIKKAEDAGPNRLNVINCGNEEVSVNMGVATPESESFSKEALSQALEDIKRGVIDVLVTLPGVDNPMDLIVPELNLDENKGLRMLVKDGLRIALATDKIPLSGVSQVLTTELITEKIKAVHSSLIHDFMVTAPRIAVLSLNPGSGVREVLSNEELEVIQPAVKVVSNSGICCFGPYAADAFFGSDEYQKFDAVLAMYYDQAWIPFRTITEEEGVNYTAGLPIVYTAPYQSVSFEKAGKNESAENSFRNAIYLAIDLFHNRLLDKKIFANPLRKQYFERGSDNEKLDLTKEE